MAVRFGVLGAAEIALEKVIPAMRAAEQVDVVAIASRDGKVARAAADRLGLPRAFEGYDALLADEDVDAVYVPLPNHLHAEWTMAAARAGKHVLCEKPLALDAGSAEEMDRACANAGVLLMEAFMYRFHPQWVAARDLARSGALGGLVTVRTMFSYDKRDPQNIRNIPEYGGGGLLDIGCYGIDAARWLFDEEPVRAIGSVRVDPVLGIDTLATGVLDFSGGRHASFTCCTQCAPDQRVDVVGTTGRLTVEIPFNTPPDRPARLFVTRGSETETVEFPAADHYTLQADAFAAAVMGDAPVPVPGTNGAANLAVIEALRASAR